MTSKIPKIPMIAGLAPKIPLFAGLAIGVYLALNYKSSETAFTPKTIKADSTKNSYQINGLTKHNNPSRIAITNTPQWKAATSKATEQLLPSFKWEKH